MLLSSLSAALRSGSGAGRRCPTTPEACLKAARDFIVSEQRALKQITGEAIRKIDADKVALAQQVCGPVQRRRRRPRRTSRLSSRSTARPRSRRSRRPRWIAGSRRRRCRRQSRAEVLAQAVMSGLREPKSPERNARLESYVDELDRLTAATCSTSRSARTRG